jgi:hypothetical protein
VAQPAPAVVEEVIASPGRPLDRAARAFMESRLGHDFSGVRVHTDARAAESAHAVGALAYTVGQHVVFAAGQYRPGTAEGRRLLAHELTHTVQQRGGPEGTPGRLLVAAPGGAAEGEAEAAAAALAHGRPFSPALAHPVQAIRVPDPDAFKDLSYIDKCICGPDVTAQTQKVVGRIKSTFATWTSDEKTGHCRMLSSPTAKVGFDIRELRNQQWVKRYRPACATLCLGEGKESCGKFYPDEVSKVNDAQASVKVGESCHYAGSVNYVAFGVMCKLCAGHMLSIASEDRPWYNPHRGMDEMADAAPFSENGMLAMIWTYKGGGIFSKPAGNYEASKKWASAGYNSSPSGFNTPPGDRSNCETKCPTKYGTAPLPTDGSADPSIGTGDFTFHWFDKPGATSGKWY